MKRVKNTTMKLVFYIFTCLSLFFSININIQVSSNTPISSATDSPISINGDAALDAFCAGNGTDGLSWNTAHVIENFEIDAVIAAGVGSAIEIENTGKFLIIRSCVLRNSEGTWSAGGIFLSHCQNISIVDCDFSNNQVGISLWYSDRISMSENDISHGETGIRLSHSNNNTIWNNEISYNDNVGVYLDSTTESNVVTENNFCENGIANVNDWGNYNQVFNNYGCPSTTIPSYDFLLIIVSTLLVVSVLIIFSRERLLK